MPLTVNAPVDSNAAPFLAVEHLTVAFGDTATAVKAVDDVSLTISRGEILALVGESGCGKSTLGYSLLGIVPPPGKATEGSIRFKGRDVVRLSKHEFDTMRGRDISMVFQGAMNAFNPVLTIGAQVEHILDAHPEVYPQRAEGRAYFNHLLHLVQLQPDRIWRSFESQLSGGMKQRVAIAVALLLKPELVILDEPTTALDVLNQRLVIDVLKDLHAELGTTVLFVTHDLAVVAELATRVAVMYAGKLVETGTVDEIFTRGGRRHPYVAALIDAIPSVLKSGLTVRPIGGSVPSLADPPPGCRFAPRCRLAEPECHVTEPPLLGDRHGHRVACHVINRSLEGLSQ
ncbi:MAG: ABC transporter ATP-binding protein [Microbacteriaceae bacterium]|nr:ABC transporter ATP-binding protein [Microbacteriaceae bacterium]MCL2793859.1 ABC transporter ATP-binding protein [Microbacteriaceae bacterium]